MPHYKAMSAAASSDMAGLTSVAAHPHSSSAPLRPALHPTLPRLAPLQAAHSSC